MPEISFDSGGEKVNAYLADAKSDKGVILIHDVFGFKYDEMRRIADFLAKNGYVALLPDLFRGSPWKSFTDFSGMPAWKDSHPQERVMQDIESAARFMRKKVSKLGITGFCWGGLQAFNAAQTGAFDAAVDFYGARFDAVKAKNIKCPFLGIFGGADKSIPLQELESLEYVLKKANVQFKIKIFQNCSHAFVQKRDAYDEQKSNEALKDMLDWFGSYLR